MEIGRLEVHGGELSVGHLDAGGVRAGVEGRADREAGAGGGAPDELDDDFATDEWSSAPVFGDVAEHPVFDLVPLAGAGREVADADPQAGLVSESLELGLPPAGPAAGAAPPRPRGPHPPPRGGRGGCPPPPAVINSPLAGG